MKKNKIKTILILLLLANFCFSGFVTFSSEVTYRKLSEVIPKAKTILKGKLISFETKKISEDKTEYLYQIRLEKIIMGNIISDADTNIIKAKYTFHAPVIRDKDGKITGGYSPLCDTSGLEADVKKGENYLFFFPKITSTDSDNPLLRIESVDKEEEVIKLITEKKTKEKEKDNKSEKK